MDKYYLKPDWKNEWDEVSREEWIKAERNAGFMPKLSADHPDYMKTLATGGFYGKGVGGRIEFDKEK